LALDVIEPELPAAHISKTQAIPLGRDGRGRGVLSGTQREGGAGKGQEKFWRTDPCSERMLISRMSTPSSVILPACRAGPPSFFGRAFFGRFDIEARRRFSGGGLRFSGVEPPSAPGRSPPPPPPPLPAYILQVIKLVDFDEAVENLRRDAPARRQRGSIIDFDEAV
jgi:hypothetical protein